MKLVILMSLFVGFAANACPDLAGDYTCEYDDTKEAYALHIAQTETDGVTSYKRSEWAGGNVTPDVADGEWHWESRRSPVNGATYLEGAMTKCADGKMIRKFKSGKRNKTDGQMDLAAYGFAEYSMAADGTLRQLGQVVDLKYNKTDDYTVTCVRR